MIFYIFNRSEVYRSEIRVLLSVLVTLLVLLTVKTTILQFTTCVCICIQAKRLLLKVCLTKHQFAMNDRYYRTVFNVIGIESHIKMHDILTYKYHNELYILIKLAAWTQTTYISITKSGGYMLPHLPIEQEWKDSHWKVVITLIYKVSENSSLNLTIERQTANILLH